MCPYFSLWHVSCVLVSCVYRYALECVFVFSSWFILSCKILIMWYMQPPPHPGFWCVVLLYTSSVVHLRCFTLPDVCRYPPVDGPDLFYISGCHWRQVVHKTLDRRGRIWGCLKKKWQKNRKQLIPLLTIILKGGWMATNLYQSYLSWTFFGRKLLIIKDINTCISLKQNPNN